MAFSKAFRITKEPRTFQAGESTGFQLSLGSQYYDRQTKQKEWSNYKAVVFANGNQLGFYQSALVVGTIIELSAEDLKIDKYNPEYLTIELIDARVGGIFTQVQPQQQASQHQQQQGNWGQPQQMPTQAQRQAPQQPQQQYNQVPESYDQDIPFAPVGLMHGNNFLHCIS